MNIAESLRAKIDDRTATVGIVGLGYVGLPLALLFAEKGFAVLGFDVDPVKIAALERGECYIRHLDGRRLASARASGRFQCTSDFARLSEPDAILICVPTPLTPHREPDLSYIESKTQQIKERLRNGQLVVLESTTYPGTTEEILKPRLEATGLKRGIDFFLAFSPEREDPGNPKYGTANIPKVVGGATTFRQIPPMRSTSATTAIYPRRGILPGASIPSARASRREKHEYAYR